MLQIVGVLFYDLSNFRSANSLAMFFDQINPYPRKVAQMLHADPTNGAKRDTFDHLKRFVKSLGGNVSAFLHFTTGASIILPEKYTQITFTQLVYHDDPLLILVACCLNYQGHTNATMSLLGNSLLFSEKKVLSHLTLFDMPEAKKQHFYNLL